MREIQQINGITRELTVDALDLFVCYKQGEEIDEDCSCDTVFMKKIWKMWKIPYRTIVLSNNKIF